MEELLRSKILARYPDHDLIGEESYDAGGHKKYLVRDVGFSLATLQYYITHCEQDRPTWIVDPSRCSTLTVFKATSI